ncbi:hypothetical protein RhiJN_14504 [Ceratobasidium sp. AG-Ba]|nr:hypothetical protein RhiJN_14504 [Ceratobasidium sp. AG-Ba]QRW15047.1 hypothetical protein RhiLY_14046 [Ceratobasidium sp. AG-Ba]
MADNFVFPCTKPPKRPFWKPKPNYSWEYAGGAFSQHTPLDFESIPEYPLDKAQWMSSQTQFQLPMPLERISPFSMSSALPLLKAGSSRDARAASEPPPAQSSANPSQSDLFDEVPDPSDYHISGGRGYPVGGENALSLSTIPEVSWATSPSAADRAEAALRASGEHVPHPESLEEETSSGHPSYPPVLLPGPGSNSSTHSGLTSDSAPRTPSMEAQKDYFAAAHSHSQHEDYLSQPDGYSHEAYPPAPHSYLSSPSTLYLRDSWGQFVLDAQSHYVSAAGSAHGGELRSNRPPSTIEEKGEKWTGEVPNVWSLFSETPTSDPVALPPSPSPAPPLPQSLSINPIFAHILWDIRFPPASASLITSKFRNMAKHSSQLWSDDGKGATRALTRLEVLAPATFPPTNLLLISSPHTRWRARVTGEVLNGAPPAYVSVADVLHALHEQLALRFVKQGEWDKLPPRTQWYVGRSYGRNRLSDTSDAGSVNSEFSRNSTGGQSMAGSAWSEGSRMSGESVNGGPGSDWGPGIRRADVLRDRTLFGGLKFDPAYKRRVNLEEGMSHLVMELRKYERDASSVSA